MATFPAILHDMVQNNVFDKCYEKRTSDRKIETDTSKLQLCVVVKVFQTGTSSNYVEF